MSKAKQSYKESLLPPLWVVALFALVFLGWLLYTLKEIVTLLVVSFAISYVIEPLVQRLEKRSIRREVGIIVVLGGFTVAVLALILTALPTIAREYGKLSDQFPSYVKIVQGELIELIQAVSTYVPGISEPIEKFLSSPMESLGQLGKGVLPKVTGGVRQALLKGYSVTLTIVNLALLPFLIFYISADFPKLFPRLVSLVPKQYKKDVRRLAGEMDGYVSGFVRGQISVCSILFLLYTVSLGILGVELWFLVAVVAGFGNMVPYLGTLIGVLLASIMTLVTFGSFTKLLIVWGIFALVQFLEGTFITPKVVGESVGLSPLVVILALIIGGQLFGLLGIFLAIPGAAIVRVLAQYSHGWFLTKVE